MTTYSVGCFYSQTYLNKIKVCWTDWLCYLTDCVTWLIVLLDWLCYLTDCFTWLIVLLDWLCYLTDCVTWLIVLLVVVLLVVVLLVLCYLCCVTCCCAVVWVICSFKRWVIPWLYFRTVLVLTFFTRSAGVVILVGLFNNYCLNCQ